MFCYIIIGASDSWEQLTMFRASSPFTRLKVNKIRKTLLSRNVTQQRSGKWTIFCTLGMWGRCSFPEIHPWFSWDIHYTLYVRNLQCNDLQHSCSILYTPHLPVPTHIQEIKKKENKTLELHDQDKQGNPMRSSNITRIMWCIKMAAKSHS
jgi:hypothetical protein